jgi:glycosyltransferase involved in cell wall biosynthesis
VSLNVLQVVPAVAARYGGPSTAILGMCRALRESGVSTLVATTDADGAGRLSVPLGEKTDYRGVPMVFFRRHGSESFKFSTGISAWLRLNVNRFDVVHVHAVFSHACLSAGRACRINGVPYIVRPLGNLDPWSLKRHAWRKKALMRLGVDRLVTAADAMHYTTDEEMRLAESGLSLPRGVVVPLGIDEACFGERRPSPTPYVLSLGRLDEKKGLDLLIRAVHQLAARSAASDWSVVIAGDGDPRYVSRLRQLAGNGPGSRRMRFCGWVEGAEKLRLLSGASLYVLPSHQENFGIAVAEAMAARVPVLVTPGVNLQDQIAANLAGWVVPNDSSSLANALEEAMGDPAELARRGERAGRLAEQFRWAHVARRLESMYRAIIAEPLTQSA